MRCATVVPRSWRRVATANGVSAVDATQGTHTCLATTCIGATAFLLKRILKITATTKGKMVIMTGQEEVLQTIKQLMIRGRVQEIMAEACIVSNDTNTAKVYGRRAMV